MKKSLGQSGQSAIEFLVTFVFTVGFVFLFIRLALNFGTGYLVHYATFMASRVYLTQDNGNGSVNAVLSNSRQEAIREFKKYKLDILNLNANDIKFNEPNRGILNEYIGTTFSYKKPFSFIKVFGGDTQVDYTSESFLGKEVPRVTCLQRMCWAMNQSDDECNMGGSHYTLFDNGC